MKDRIDVLDKGYVRRVAVMGNDLSIINAARVSFDKESDTLDERDERLLHFLARERHMSPFRHAMATFEVYAPLMVARQWWKYVVGSDHTMDSWNESSRRYVTEEPEFYVPADDDWRSAPEHKKQGSGDPVEWIVGQDLTGDLQELIEEGVKLYEKAMDRGVCPEQARLFLPAYGMYVRWRWTASLQSIVHFLEQRLADDAQYEIQEYARAVHMLISLHFPMSINALLTTQEPK